MEDNPALDTLDADMSNDTENEEDETTTEAETTDGNEAVYKEKNETVYASKAVNIRKGPSTSFGRVAVLQKGHSITRVAIGDNGWSKVSYNGETYYISSEYLTLTKPAVTTTAATTNPSETTTEASTETTTEASTETTTAENTEATTVSVTEAETAA